MKHHLVVANQTLGGQALLDAIHERAVDDETSFTVVVPATRHAGFYDTVLNAYAGEPSTVEMTAAETQAEERLHALLTRLHDAGVRAEGFIGDEDPLAAVEDALATRAYDEILLSTLPPGASRWLKMDLVHRLERTVDVPVAHVYGSPTSPDS